VLGPEHVLCDASSSFCCLLLSLLPQGPMPLPTGFDQVSSRHPRYRETQVSSLEEKAPTECPELLWLRPSGSTFPVAHNRAGETSQLSSLQHQMSLNLFKKGKCEHEEKKTNFKDSAPHT
jgi:hypothetical protein